MFSKELYQTHLNTKFLGREIKYLSQANSTNEAAWEYFQDESPEGTLVITDNQQRGKGRRQNKWVSTKGKSLTLSFILQPELPLEKLGLLPLLTGVSIVKAIQSETSIHTGLKWPNDNMLNEKKMDAEMFTRMTSNHFLNSLGNPTHVEGKIGIIFENEGLDKAFNYIEEELILE